jgi:predicted Zn-dependent peptidase
MQSVREGKGYTYDIFSGLSSMKEGAYKAIFTEVNCIQRRETLSAIYDEISRLQQEPVPSEELNRVRRYMLGDLIRSFDGPFAKAESYRNVFDSGLDNTYYENLIHVIKTIEPDEIMRIAQTYYKIEELHEITAG